MKPKWEKPELIVLVKGAPDESAVSINCKHDSLQSASNPTHLNTACNYSPEKQGCGTCHNNANRS